MDKVVLSTFSIDELTEKISQRILAQIKENESKDSKGFEGNEFLTREEVAEMCGVKALSTLWNWSKQGTLIPRARAGRKPLYKYQDVIDFLNGKEGGYNV
ncbi:helix-turn-helix transcriptional regulator [Flagellimonas sp.]|uniref:helix-turn-helix transcriptional regulator n=1 Tax=Flagellimonas sp. TaxID=2058762 RepID=UPI003BAA0D1F